MPTIGGFDLDPFLLFTDHEHNPCIADADPQVQQDYIQITCRSDRGHMRAGKRLSNLSMVIPCEPAPDVLFTWMSECLIQERVLRIFQDEALTGFATRPATARLKTSGEPVRVSELLVTGWGGMAAKASGIREVFRCQACGHLDYSGLEEPRDLLDVNNWDGSDFFIIWPLPKFRFVTGRVAEVCRKHSITGVALERNFPLPSGRVISGYSPGRLSYYFPTERAHALGDPLDIF